MPRPNLTPAQRGYGPEHHRLRRQWAKRVARGGVTCWRCGAPILPGQLWDLGHDDNDRTRYRGPEHRKANRAAGARKTNLIKRAKRAVKANESTAIRW